MQQTATQTYRMSLGRARALVAFSYVVAIVVGILSTLALDSFGPFTIDGLGDITPVVYTAFADLIATVVIFIFSMLFNNSSFYDPYWSVIPIAIAIYFMMMGVEGVNESRQWIVFGLVAFWGLRLTWNWLRGWTGLKHEDWRYIKFREMFGPRLYPLISFLGIHFFPTLMVFIGCISLWPALATGTQPMNWLDGVAFVVTFGAILIEMIADNQLRTHLRTRADNSIHIERGLWSWSRHPNYFGEIGFWVGLFLFSLAADPAWWMYTLPGPVAMIALFLGYSVPALDKKNLANKPGYADYRKRVSALIPLPPKKAK